MVSFCLSNYKTVLKAVECKNGSFADPNTGRRLERDWQNLRYVFSEQKNKSRVVCQNLRKPIYTATYEADASSVGICIWKATRVNKNGLDWVKNFQYIFLSKSINAFNISKADAELLDCLKIIKTEDFSAHALMPVDSSACDNQFSKFPKYEQLTASLNEKLTPETVFFLIVNAEYNSSLLKIYNMRTQKFGVEIEFTGITRYQASKVLAKHFGTQQYHYGGTYDSYTVKDSRNRTWKISRDSSIKPEHTDHSPAGNNYKCELITPVLCYTEIEDLQCLIRELRTAGMCVNSSCGIHVHVDAAKQTAASIKRLSNIIYYYENSLYFALGVSKTRVEHWCKTSNKNYIKTLNNSSILKMSDVKKIWYSNYYSPESWHYHPSRYHALNLHSLWQANTGIEFRLFNSTTHAGKIKCYIQLSLALCNYALNTQSYDESQNEVSLLPVLSNTDFFAWINAIGLIGDEFKTARIHLMRRYNTVNANSIAA